MQVGVIMAGQADAPEVMATHAAIEAALAKTFGDQGPLAWARHPAGTLALVRAYWVDSERGPYFHYLSWGLSLSGFGIELTMKVRAFESERVATSPRAQLAPLWPVELMARLSMAVERTGRPYGHEHWLQAGQQGFGPEGVRHLAFAFDSAIEPVQTQLGSFRFLQLFTIDEAELEQCKAADRAHTPSPVVPARLAADPRLVIDRRQP